MDHTSTHSACASWRPLPARWWAIAEWRLLALGALVDLSRTYLRGIGVEDPDVSEAKRYSGRSVRGVSVIRTERVAIGVHCAHMSNMYSCAAICCTMLHMDKTLSPPSKPPRVSVPLDGQVLQVFQRMAKAGNMSTGRAIAEWLSDTVEAAEHMTATMERARSAPKLVMRELHAYALGLADETGDTLREMIKKGKEHASETPEQARKRSARVGSEAMQFVDPPSCNTGGKVPKTTHKRGT